MYAIMGSSATWLGGALVDLRWNKSRQTRAIVCFGVIVALNSSTWIWAVIIQNEYSHTLPTLDWSNPDFGRGFGLYMFERLSLGIVENYIYW